MSSQLTLVAPPHRNRRLFSDHYLDAVLPRADEWQQGVATAAEPLARLREIIARFVPSDNEAQTENDLIRPVLLLLGHDFEVQPSLRTPDGAKRPDYVLYRSAAALDANKGATLTEELLRDGLAVADAKYWERPLDQALHVGRDPFTNKNPGYQIAFYVQHTGLPWGVLTNGRQWRLYHRDTAHKLDCFYEVDLPDLLERNDPAAFQYFLRFFQRAAFDPGPLSLERHLQASATYQRTVSDSLREQVYDALRHVAQGFLDFPRNGLRPEANDLRRIYDNALILLYRLLFVLYAEARGLLPVEESAPYRETYGLHAIKREVAQQITTGRMLLPDSDQLWPRLRYLFRIINEGSPPLKVATFNGGLFDPQRHPFLEEHTVGDGRLQEALDRLARVTVKDEGRVFVDYRDLSERHLGTIYEGLLEFRLQALPQPEGDWSVELVTDRGERKASGSYYTPGFITRFMVEQAVGPAVDAALARGAAEGPDAQARAVLNLNVLDCAMGSGHFLVETVEYISRRLVEADLLPPAAEPRFDELAHWKRRVAQSCIYGVDLNPLAVDLAKLSVWLTTAARDRPLSFLDHHLRPGNALVGARMEELNAAAPAVKRRKSAARARQERAEAAGQLSLASDSAFTQSMSRAVGSMWLIEESAADTVDAVKSQEALYAEVREAFTRRYSRLADLVTASHFGLEVDDAMWRPLADFAAGRTIAPLPKFREWLEQARKLAEEQRFFHWELEFPEVFFDRFGRPLGKEAGFDVVIGNPPYVRQERLAPLKPYFAEAFPEVYHGMADLSVYFFLQGLRLLQEAGRLAFISSNSWLQTAFAEPLRRYVRTTATVETLVDLGNNRTFAEAPDVCPSVFVITKLIPCEEHRFASVLFHRGETPILTSQTIAEKTARVCQLNQADSGWQFEPDAVRGLLKRIRDECPRLGHVISDQLLSGIKTGLNEAFIVEHPTYKAILESDSESSKLLGMSLRGQDLRPWYQAPQGLYLIAIPCGWTRATFGESLDETALWRLFSETHPMISQHLLGYESQARRRQDQGDFWWELRPCAYHEQFARTKLIWPDISKVPRFSFDAEGQFINNTCFLIPNPSLGLLGYLQSRIAWHLISQICLHNKFRAGLWEYRLLPQFLRDLPVPEGIEDAGSAGGDCALRISERARARYALHQRVRHQVQRDLGTPEKALNQKLTAWWTLDFPGLRAELGKVYKRDIPVRERGEWDEWLREQRAEHDRLTGEIIGLETELNDRVYRLFHLTPDEIKLIEDSTKYRYGEV